MFQYQTLQDNNQVDKMANIECVGFNGEEEEWEMWQYSKEMCPEANNY